jgi:hypothetical protein
VNVDGELITCRDIWKNDRVRVEIGVGHSLRDQIRSPGVRILENAIAKVRVNFFDARNAQGLPHALWCAADCPDFPIG